MKSKTEMVIVKNNDGFETKITTDFHTLTADEPVKSGGTGTGPTPYDLLLSAFGACIAITLRMYSEIKNIPLEAVTIKLDIKKIYAEDCANCETEEGKLENIDVEIEFTGSISEEQRKRLLEIANKCPVHKTLKSEVKINTTLKDNS